MKATSCAKKAHASRRGLSGGLQGGKRQDSKKTGNKEVGKEKEGAGATAARRSSQGWPESVRVVEKLCQEGVARHLWSK